MSETLSIELQIYLGDLQEQFKTNFDWFEKKKLLTKINAVELLLGLKIT